MYNAQAAIVHKQFSWLRPFFTRNALLLSRILPMLAFVFALGKGGAVLLVHYASLNVDIATMNITGLVQQHMQVQLEGLKPGINHSSPSCLGVIPELADQMKQHAEAKPCDGWEFDCSNICHRYDMVATAPGLIHASYFLFC